MADTNSMQASLGLSDGLPGTSFVPTQDVPIPTTRHPGEISQILAQQAQVQAMQTRSVTMPNASATLQTGGIFNPALAASAAQNPVGSFASYYANNYAAISSGHASAYGASAYGLSPTPGLTGGMMPMAGSFTDPSMGIYRARMPFVPTTPMYPSLPREPLFGGPFYTGLPTQSYTTPVQQIADLGMTRSAQSQGMMSAAVGLAGRGGIDLAGGFLGGSLGAAAGAFLGGPVGARIGGTLGSLLGFAGADAAIGQSAGQAFNANNPISVLAQRTAQVQGMSANFVTGGPSLSFTGRGLNAEGAVSIARYLENTGNAAGSGYNSADLTRIMDQSSKAGLMDMAQGAPAIKARLAEITTVLRQFMQITNDPDVVSAIKELGNMRSLGMSLTESASAAQAGRMYARMAGTSLRGLREAGNAGAMLYQSQGLSAGLGYEMGQGAAGMAAQAIAAGTYSEAQLARMGGAPGLAQRQMEAAAATLKIPMLAASVSKMLPNGTFALDSDAVKKLLSGDTDLHTMAADASSRMSAAGARGGASAIAMYQLQEGDLQSALGQALGPVGTQVFQMQQVANTMRRYGLQGPAGYSHAAMMMFPGDPDMAKNMTYLATNPAYRSYLQRGLADQEADIGTQKYQRHENLRAQHMEYVTSEFDRSFMRKVTDPFSVLGSKFGSAVDYLTRMSRESSEDSAARERGAYVVRYGDAARIQSPFERDVVDRKAFDPTKVSPEMRQAMNVTTARETLFENHDLADFVRRKEGEGTGGWAKARRIGNWLTFGISEDKSDEIMAKFRSYDAASKFGEASEASADEGTKAKERLKTKFGAGYAKKTRDVYAAIQGEAAKSKGGATWLGQILDIAVGLGTTIGSATGASSLVAPSSAGREEQFISIATSLGITQEELKDFLRAQGVVNKMGTPNPLFLDPANGAGAMKSARAEQMGTAAKATFSNMADAMFDWKKGGNATSEKAVRSYMFSDDPHATAIAGLMGAIGQGDEKERSAASSKLEEYAAAHNLELDQFSKSAARARLMLAGMESLGDDGNRLQRTFGKKLSGMSVAEIGKFIKDAQETVVANASSVELADAAFNIQNGAVKGMEQKVYDAVSGEGGKGLVALVDSQSGDDFLEKINKVFGKNSAMQDALKRYDKEKGASDGGADKALLNLNKGLRNGFSNTADHLVTDYTSSTTQVLRDSVARVGVALEGIMREGADTFKLAADANREAAKAANEGAVINRSAATVIEQAAALLRKEALAPAIHP